MLKPPFLCNLLSSLALSFNQFSFFLCYCCRTLFCSNTNLCTLYMSWSTIMCEVGRLMRKCIWILLNRASNQITREEGYRVLFLSRRYSRKIKKEEHSYTVIRQDACCITIPLNSFTRLSSLIFIVRVIEP